MYYRVAIQMDAAPTWQWKSTVLSSLDTLFHFLRLFRTLPHDQLRVFSSSSRVGLAEQLEQENKGLASTSVTAAQFLRERMLRPPAGVRAGSHWGDQPSSSERAGRGGKRPGEQGQECSRETTARARKRT